MEKLTNSIKGVLLLSSIVLNLSSSAQCVPGNVGNNHTVSGTYTVSWHSQLVVNESDSYKNNRTTPVNLIINNFSFNARRLGNPVTPFVVLVRQNNDFLVMAVGDTRYPGDYSLGPNTFSFSNSATSIIVPPGGEIATGFIEARPNGSGVNSATTVTLDTNGDESWYTGGPSNNASGSVQVGKQVGVGQYSFPNLNWSYRFNISMCEANSPLYATMPNNTNYLGVNVDSDAGDINIGDGICEDARGYCSLRAAIQEANASPGSDVILFSATGDIQLDGPLPDINSSIIIDGYSAAGYQSNAPSVHINGNGFNPFKFEFADGITVRGLDISSASIGGFDSYALNFYTCRNVEVYDNVIRNRVRAIHANGVFDLTIENNDFRDCGDEAVDGAIFLRHVLEEDIPGGFRIRNNQYGPINADPKSLFQIHYCRDVLVSDGSIPGTNLEITNAGAFDYPMRFYQSARVQISNTNLSSTAATRAGTGIQLLDCQETRIENTSINRRRSALHINGGNAITVKDNDFIDSGISSDEGGITISNFMANDANALDIHSNLLGSNLSDVPTLLSMYDCQGVSIGNTGGNEHISLDGVQDSYYPIRINGGSDYSINDLTFSYASPVYHQSKAVWLKNAAANVSFNNNYFEGWAAAVHIESGNNIAFDCNSFARNRNGMLVDNASTFSSISNNNFGCNAVAIQQRGSLPINTIDNYWGHAAGSSSSGGAGDYVIGNVSTSSFLANPSSCAPIVTPSVCTGEICGNGIDDDLDGLVDCDDGSCADDPACTAAVTNTHAALRNAEITQIEEVFRIHPNPTRGVLNITLYEPCTSYRLYDMLGATILEGTLENLTNTQVDLNGIDNGAYMIELKAGERIVVKRLIKN